MSGECPPAVGAPIPAIASHDRLVICPIDDLARVRAMNPAIGGERVDPKIPKAGSKLLPGGNHVEVVGESFYANALTETIGLAGESFGGTMLWASLVPDPGNPYDSTTVGRRAGRGQTGINQGGLPWQSSPCGSSWKLASTSATRLAAGTRR